MRAPRTSSSVTPGCAGNWGEVAHLFGSVAGGTTDFGRAVDVGGNTVVVGEPTTDGVGNVFVFTRDPFGIWVETKRLSPPDDFVRFGQTLTLDGDRLLVGAPGQFTNPGFAYLHERNQGGAGNWGLVRTFSFSPPGEEDVGWGTGVALHGDTAAVSDPGTGLLGRDTGLVDVFQRDQSGPNAWGFVVRHFGENSDDNLGQDLVLRGDRLLVGSRDANAAYSFGRNQGGPSAWGLLQKHTPSDPQEDSLFGVSVDLTGGGVFGENAIIGTPQGSTGNFEQGFAYIFGNTQPRPILGDVSGAIGGGNAVVLIGSIEDGEQSATTLIARINGGESATVNGVTLSNLAIGSDGAVTANVDVACGASDASFELSFTDGDGLVVDGIAHDRGRAERAARARARKPGESTGRRAP